MLFSKNSRLEDKIVELAVNTPIAVKALRETLADAEGGPSLRAVYKAVDHLLDAGVLVKAGKRVRTSEEWVRGVSAMLAPAPIAPLGVGERVSYTFTSIDSLDAFWKTAVLQLERYEKDGQVLFYNPHNFWAYMPGRRKSEEAYYRHFTEEGLHAFFTVGGECAADLQFKRAYQDSYLQIDARNMQSFPRNSHVTVLGDFVITVRLPKAMASAIDGLYGTDRPIEEILPEIVSACEKPGNIRFVLEHDPRKARMLKRPLSLNFYFKLN